MDPYGQLDDFGQNVEEGFTANAGAPLEAGVVIATEAASISS